MDELSTLLVTICMFLFVVSLYFVLGFLWKTFDIRRALARRREVEDQLALAQARNALELQRHIDLIRSVVRAQSSPGIPPPRYDLMSEIRYAPPAWCQIYDVELQDLPPTYEESLRANSSRNADFANEIVASAPSI